MTKRAYKLAALFCFVIGVTGILAAISMGVDRAFHSATTVFYLIIGITGLLAGGAVRFDASRKT
jgi:predicted membrane channel-forming protein YqfA (hemolysin III family)